VNNDSTTGMRWRTSSHSNGQGNCVETAATGDGGHAVRDSKKKTSGPILHFAPGEWRAFIHGTRQGSVGPQR